jgi:hypothetical protein
MNVEGLAQALRSSSDKGFAAVGPEQVLLAVQLVKRWAARAAEGGGSAGSQDRMAEDMRARGRCWTLVGAARLALVAPAAGTDPARKPALKQQRLRGFLERELQPQLEVNVLCDHMRHDFLDTLTIGVSATLQWQPCCERMAPFADIGTDIERHDNC